jgi:hypothetical protein
MGLGEDAIPCLEKTANLRRQKTGYPNLIDINIMFISEKQMNMHAYNELKYVRNRV